MPENVNSDDITCSQFTYRVHKCLLVITHELGVANHAHCTMNSYNSNKTAADYDNMSEY